MAKKNTERAATVEVKNRDLDMVEAENVSVSRSSVGVVDANRIEITQSGVLTVEGSRVENSRSLAAVVSGRDVELNQAVTALTVGKSAGLSLSTSGVTIARERALVDRSAVGLLAAGEIEARDSTAVLMLARHVEGNVTTLLDWKGALGITAVIGGLMGLYSLLRR